MRKIDFFLEDISKCTSPASVLVGSGEQSFMDLMYKNKLKEGRYCGITPCFRDEEVDELHNKYFMKVELIDTKNVSEASLNQIIKICENFFSLYCSVETIPVKQMTNSWLKDTFTYDIINTDTGIELGSYGIREYDKYKWIFATGLAEPRLSKVLNKIKKDGF